MTIRKAIVLNADGVKQELPDGDTLAGGGGSVLETKTVIVAPAQYGQSEHSQAYAGVTTTSVVECFLVSNEDFDDDDLEDCKVSASCEVDLINFTILCDGPIVGTYTIKFKVTL
jgi:hypothetical protein